MTSNTFINTIARTAWLIAGLAMLTLTACSDSPVVNPFAPDDELTAETSTPSRDGFLAAGAEPTIRRRDFPQTAIPVVKREIDAVSHYPLWWEDPFEDQGDCDNTFAWTWQDYFATPYSFGRFLLNTMLWPVSAAVTPPGTVLVSNGQLYVPPQDRIVDIEFLPHPHDAYPGQSQDPTATHTDFIMDSAPR